MKFLISATELLFRRSFSCLYVGNVPISTSGRVGAAEYTVERLMPQRGNTVVLFEERLNEALIECEDEVTMEGQLTAGFPPVFRLI